MMDMFSLELLVCSDFTNGLNSGPYSVMTYNFYGSRGYTPPSNSNHPVNCGCLTCLGAFDIAHLQYLYGPNPYWKKR